MQNQPSKKIDVLVFMRDRKHDCKYTFFPVYARGILNGDRKPRVVIEILYEGKRVVRKPKAPTGNQTQDPWI